MNETSKSEINSMLASIIIIITVAFIAVEVAIWTGALQVSGLGNLGYGVDKLLENPAFVGLLSTIDFGTSAASCRKSLKQMRLGTRTNSLKHSITTSP